MAHLLAERLLVLSEQRQWFKTRFEKNWYRDFKVGINLIASVEADIQDNDDLLPVTKEK